MQEMKATTSPSKDQNINILPADEGSYTVVFNSADYLPTITTLLSDNNTYDTQQALTCIG